jgi:hypothetical protein
VADFHYFLDGSGNGIDEMEDLPHPRVVAIREVLSGSVIIEMTLYVW